MPLEAVMVCIDTSEHMRNGDFVPTRHECVVFSFEAFANLIVGAKMQQNPENSVGVLSMASTGRCAGAQVLVSPTDDMGKILSSLHDAKVAGKVNFVESVQVAQLALKHRRNKNGSQRIILFVGSPIEAEEAALVKAAKLLKKNNVAVDVVLLGSDPETTAKLRAFVDAANSNENSNLVTIPVGVVPSDALVSSPIIQGDRGSGGEGGGAAAFTPTSTADFGGVDANLDPELAMALRVSMEEERARQDADAAASNNSNNNNGDVAPAPATAEGAEAAPAPATPAAAPAAAALDDPASLAEFGEDEDALLQRALAMSMSEAQAANNKAEAEAAEDAATQDAKTTAATTSSMDVDDDDDETMQLALQMSMQQGNAAAAAASSSSSSSSSAPSPPPAPAAAAVPAAPAFNDPSFVEQMLAQLPGVDVNDPQIQAALARIQSGGAPPADPENQDDNDKKK